MDPHAPYKELTRVEFITMCRTISGCMQTYEGGIGGEPGNEAHGGYTYCGLAALMLVGRADVLNLPSLLHFAVRCQASLTSLSAQPHQPTTTVY